MLKAYARALGLIGWDELDASRRESHLNLPKRVCSAANL